MQRSKPASGLMRRWPFDWCVGQRTGPRPSTARRAARSVVTPVAAKTGHPDTPDPGCAVHGCVPARETKQFLGSVNEVACAQPEKSQDNRHECRRRKRHVHQLTSLQMRIGRQLNTIFDSACSASPSAQRAPTISTSRGKRTCIRARVVLSLVFVRTASMHLRPPRAPILTCPLAGIGEPGGVGVGMLLTLR